MILTHAHALTVAAVFHSVDRGMDSSFTEITTQKFADIPERPLSLFTSPILRDPLGRKVWYNVASDRVGFLSGLFYTMKSPRILFFCHTCVMGFKLKRVQTNSADPVFVSSVCNVRFSKLF